MTNGIKVYQTCKNCLRVVLCCFRILPEVRPIISDSLMIENPPRLLDSKSSSLVYYHSCGNVSPDDQAISPLRLGQGIYPTDIHFVHGSATHHVRRFAEPMRPKIARQPAPRSFPPLQAFAGGLACERVMAMSFPPAPMKPS